MFDVFGSVKGLLKLDSVCIDNNIFRLHYKATVVFLVISSLLVTSRQYIGDPIDCIVEGIPPNVMDTYCWIHSTFSVPNRWVGELGTDVPHPGVGVPYPEEEIKYHKYYQWMCFFLFFQAILFYVPRYLWKTWEGGKVKMLVMDLNCPIVDEGTKCDRKKLLVDYFTANLHQQNFYAFRFFICEVINFINVIGQIYFMDFFLGGEFTTYGADVVKFTEMEPEDRPDPMAKVFIWFWFIILAVLSALAVLYRFGTVFSGAVRLYLLRARSRLANPDDVETINRKCQIGDWFVLYQIGKNMDPLIFKDFLRDLARRLEGKDTV
ncbi:unnamed protein product [Cyprideis torosa]|uniref:Innexin n=1 Tax=Cyprideis torosa TaxID=163714 RepID=A0A7R8WHW7_9CRUS|nr:unnamed protein product [Cyprideis torosa]CAG0893462.1 unnamed protein product [Cyprideis torosa]